MMKKFWLIGLVILMVACGEKDKPSAEITNPNELIQSAAQKLDEANSFQLTLGVKGAPVLLDAETIGIDLTLAVVGAEGVFVRPDGLQGNVNISIDEVVAEVNMVVIGKDQYLRHILLTLGNWQQITFSPSFDAADLVAGENSIANTLRALENPVYVGKTDLDGVEMHHIRGELEAARVKTVTVGLTSLAEGKIGADIYIRTRDGLVEQIVLNEPVPPDQSTIWTLGFYGYNGDYRIERPEIAE